MNPSLPEIENTVVEQQIQTNTREVIDSTQLPSFYEVLGGLVLASAAVHLKERNYVRAGLQSCLGAMLMNVR